MVKTSGLPNIVVTSGTLPDLNRLSNRRSQEAVDVGLAFLAGLFDPDLNEARERYDIQL